MGIRELSLWLLWPHSSVSVGSPHAFCEPGARTPPPVLVRALADPSKRPAKPQIHAHLRLVVGLSLRRGRPKRRTRAPVLPTREDGTLMWKLVPWMGICGSGDDVHPAKRRDIARKAVSGSAKQRAPSKASHTGITNTRAGPGRDPAAPRAIILHRSMIFAPAALHRSVRKLKEDSGICDAGIVEYAAPRKPMRMRSR